MKILVINGSPRKGNTYRVVKKVEERMSAHGNVEFEYIHLKDAKLEYCKGCMNCFTRGDHLCPIKGDGRIDMEAKLLSADGVIFASPNYASNVSALMKNFIDRFAYTGHRPRFFNQYALLVTTSAGPGGEDAIKAMQGPLEKFGFNVVQSLCVMSPPFEVPQKHADATEKDITISAEKLYSAITEKMTRTPSFNSIMGFVAFNVMGRKFPEMFDTIYPADSAYWKSKGWLEPGQYYFVDARISPVTKLMAWAAGQYAIRYLKKNILYGKDKPASATTAVKA